MGHEFGGFERVVAPDQGTVLAPTRSIGDCEFDIVGVVPLPEVTHFKLTGQEHVLILASDGLWEFVSSSQAVKMVLQCEDATQACDKLVQLSKKCGHKMAMAHTATISPLLWPSCH